MAFDALFMACLKTELERELIGAKIDKVQQPDKDLIILAFRGKKLLISLNSSNGRVQITNENFENPMTPPMFCMLLRKHLTGGKIVAITQAPADRVLDFEIEVYDALGVMRKKHLITELMGRYTNLILTGEDYIITDCTRRIGFDISEKRQILPGLLYRPPSESGRKNPFDTELEELFYMLNAASGIALDKFITKSFDGFSPLIAREVVYRAYGVTSVGIEEAEAKDGFESFVSAFSGLINEIKSENTTPFMLTDSDGKPKDFSFTKIGQYEGAMKGETLPTFSGLLGEFYAKKDRLERTRSKTQAIYKNIRRARDRAQRRVEAQRQELILTADRDTFRENGDIITANIYRMKKGMETLIADDFYSENGAKREIKLDPLKTPQQNAAKYYKDYNKAKTAEIHLKEQIEKGERETVYLESVLESLLMAETERDVMEIRQELAGTGYIKGPKNPRKERPIVQKPMHFVSSSGLDIWAGKNNSQNDALTMKTAFKRDLWLHTQKIHGSHVIISTGGSAPDERSIFEAATIAAFYSQAKDSDNVPVDYTLVKFVKKPAGARPGMVIYTDYKTIYVKPDEDLVESLRAK